ncbi:MAG: hypothetical protein MI867_17020 [Pseudomonadales bacterium]|nr:hypothetical protein [Pseudomonadales bacterium]
MKKLNTTLLAFLPLIATFPSYGEDCFQMVERSDLVEKVINGETVLVVKPDAVIAECNLYDKAKKLAEDAQAQAEENEAQLKIMQERYKELYAQKENYYDLVLKYDKVLENSRTLIGNFESHSEKWGNLYQEYKTLTDDYDKLADTYRDIAQNFSTPISFDIGGGVTEDHDFAGLIGVGIYRFRLYGFFQEDNNGVLATYTFPWSKL